MKKIITIAIIFICFLLLGYQVYEKIAKSRRISQRQRSQIPVAVEVSDIKRGTIQDVREFTGSLFPFSEFVVAPKIAGRLETILVHIGDKVTGGQLVAKLDDDEYLQAVGQAEAEVKVAQANFEERQNELENSRREYERISTLYKKKIVSESQFDTAASELQAQQAKLKVATAQVSQKEAALEMAKVRLSYTQIRINEESTNGFQVVGERFVDEGAMLAANTPIVSILDIDKLIAVIYVIERDYPKIEIGLEATVSTDAFPQKVFKGRVVRIAPLLKETSREARVELEVPNDRGALKPGMFVRAQILFDEKQNTTIVPKDAFVKRDNRLGIFIADLEERKARFVPVTIGIENGANVEVLSPEITGKAVVLGQHLLGDGAPIMLPSQPQTENSEKNP